MISRHIKQIGMSAILSFSFISFAISADEVPSAQEEMIDQKENVLFDAFEENHSHVVAKACCKKKRKDQPKETLLTPPDLERQQIPFQDWISYEKAFDEYILSIAFPSYPVEISFPEGIDMQNMMGMTDMLMVESGDVVYTLVHVLLNEEEMNTPCPELFTEFEEDLVCELDVDLISCDSFFNEENDGYEDIVLSMEIPISMTQEINIFSCVRIIKKKNHVFMLQTSSIYPEKLQNHDSYVQSFQFRLSHHLGSTEEPVFTILPIEEAGLVQE